ncbi:hypothetical protein SBA3_2610004 [Candidatus Sulfopaludibacter sp. SbA3]|nr:hypothetical protein SBA3_2610004 [Candidatus Sulfopaludibacter sp. SbA3]
MASTPNLPVGLTLALDGTFTEEHRWLLAKELRQIEFLEGQTVSLEEEIEGRAAAFEEPMQRLIPTPGVDRKTAWTIIAEIGVDLTTFADAKHLASWAGLCPGNRESAGKRMRGRMRKANRYVKRATCQAAWAASHTALDAETTNSPEPEGGPPLSELCGQQQASGDSVDLLRRGAVHLRSHPLDAHRYRQSAHGHPSRPVSHDTVTGLTVPRPRIWAA